ncbi:hypothetical protein [Pseudophaeobacter leonis]|uniref:hypothetical protein n=1 Tax=Pseudophaeobacter leonis TaxID=1144477 RepID=UPI00137472B8|nr:hypothetical protein [Pseudophaeobacter leonis]
MRNSKTDLFLTGVLKSRKGLIWWRAEWDKSENYYHIEIKGPFSWHNARSPKLSTQRIEAERLINEFGIEAVASNRQDFVTVVQGVTSVTRRQAWNAVDRAIRKASV